MHFMKYDEICQYVSYWQTTAEVIDISSWNSKQLDSVTECFLNPVVNEF